MRNNAQMRVISVRQMKKYISRMEAEINKEKNETLKNWYTGRIQMLNQIIDWDTFMEVITDPQNPKP